MKRVFKVAAWSGIFSAILSALMWVLILAKQVNNSSQIYSLAVIATSLLTAMFLYGFAVLGKKFNSTMLLVMAWIGIILVLTSVVFVAYTAFAKAQNADGATGALILVWVVFSVIMGAYSILFGVGLLKIKDKVEKAKTAGILEIIGGATFIILVGFVIKFVAYIYEIILLFKASKKLEK